MAASKIGFWAATSLVVGNMIGSGVFLLPASLAAFGGISLLGWLVSATGAWLLARVFGELSRRIPRAGGPYAYTRAGLGEFAAFLVAWGYWVSIWCGNAAITVAFVSYMSVFFPILAHNKLAAIALGLGAIWGLSWVNSRGIRAVGRVQLLTTVLKLLPLLAIGLVGVFFVEWSHFRPFNLSGQPEFAAITATASLTLWAFLGMESATVPAEEVRNASKTIPRATLAGTLLAAGVYLAATVAVMGLVPPQQLAHSAAPFAEAAAHLWGEAGRQVVAAGAAIATFGALNGWIMVQGRIPLAMARDGLFPALFARTNRQAAPYLGIAVSSLLVSGLMLMNFSQSLVKQFEFAILLSTMSVLIPYLFSTAAFAVLLFKQPPASRARRNRLLLLAALAFGFSFWAVAGVGEQAVYWGFLLLTAGMPVYVWRKGKNSPGCKQEK